MSTEREHVLIVGGSFAGMAAAIQLGRARRLIRVVDAGRPRNRFARSSHGFLGQDGRSPAEIGAAFREQVLAYPTVRLTQGEVERVSRATDGDFEAVLASGETVWAERLILATGVVDELPPVPGLAERWGVSVLHCPYCHGFEVRDRRLGVMATGEMSLHQVALLRDWSDHVTLFTAGVVEVTAEQREDLVARGIRVEEQAVAALVGEAPELSGVRLGDGSYVELDALFTGSRTRPASPLAEQLGCELEEGVAGVYVRTDPTKETSVQGVFCAGDAARAMHNATFAAADGAMAGVAAHRSLVFPPAPAT